MTEGQTNPWAAKLLARIHDPAEKALVLLRDPAGHEGGTTAALRERLADATAGIDRDLIRRADQWAAAADRPQFATKESGQFPEWAKVRFHQEGELTHPLGGDRVQLADLGADVGVEPLKALSLDHFDRLIHRTASGVIEPQRTSLAFWRFGPNLPAPEINALWRLLPADTRVPDHTIWEHLELTSAFAGAFAADPNDWPALLQVSIGPVQSFIARARRTSDLWAGSHMLATFAFEAMRPILERYGPDAFILPQLRGVPEVDRWLRDEQDIDGSLFDACAWTKRTSEANPLFVAALPNRFLAIVPASICEDLGHEIREHVQRFAQDQAFRAVREVYRILGEDPDAASRNPISDQLAEQFADFPDVTWSTVDWRLAGDRRHVPADPPLREALATFHPEETQTAPGLFGTALWRLCHQTDGRGFLDPNPGTVYPAIYELGDRALAAAKQTRAFEPLSQEGYRASLSPDLEWLTEDRAQLELTPRQRREADTLWMRVSRTMPSLAQPGEHLSAIYALKRVWPRLMGERYRIEDDAGDDAPIRRRVVSTHTLAFAPDLRRLIDDSTSRSRLMETSTGKQALTAKQATLPRRLHSRIGQDSDLAWLRNLPRYLDDQRDKLDSDDPDRRQQGEMALAQAEANLREALGQTGERYYAVVLMDGDRMGAWLSGTHQDQQVELGRVLHSKVAHGLRTQARELHEYVEAERPGSPSRHAAISDALNGFALGLAQPIVEEVCTGQLIYAGGDDLMAMCASEDILRLMGLLRLSYSGIRPSGAVARLGLGRPQDATTNLDLSQGYARTSGPPFETALHRTTLRRMMGPRATASMGVVLAHAMTPLDHVLSEVRAAESAAKSVGRDAFAVKVLKRSGGQSTLPLPFGFAAKTSGEIPPVSETPFGRFQELVTFLAQSAVSRRAAYQVQAWLPRLPTPDAFEGNAAAYRDMLARTLGYQFRRQVSPGLDDGQASEAAERAAAGIAHMPGVSIDGLAGRLHEMLTVAEFLARPARMPGLQASTGDSA